MLINKHSLNVTKVGCPRVMRIHKIRGFGSPKGVSQIRIRVRQMMCVDQFEMFACTNRSIMAT